MRACCIAVATAHAFFDRARSWPNDGATHVYSAFNASQPSRDKISCVVASAVCDHVGRPSIVYHALNASVANRLAPMFTTMTVVRL